MGRKVKCSAAVLAAMWLPMCVGCNHSDPLNAGPRTSVPTSQPAASSLHASGAVTCTLEPMKNGSVRVRWEFQNLYPADVWIPLRFDVSFEAPKSELPFFFLVPGGRIMAVSALFSTYPEDIIGIEEGSVGAELLRVAPGARVTGQQEIQLPFTRTESERGFLRPHPFTPDVMQMRSEPPGVFGESRRAPKMEQIHTATSFQMAVQVFHLPVSDMLHSATKPDSTSEHGKATNDRMIIGHDISDDMSGGAEIGRYWASCLSQMVNHTPKTLDFAEWCVSPVYKVNWPVGEHPPVGITDPLGLLSPDGPSEE